jgi:DNA-binding transcriptional LysR family regulator
VRLTPAGRSFLPEARRILKLAESASQVARRIAMGKTGSLKLGYTAAAAYGYLPELIAACRARLPEVDFSLKGNGAGRPARGAHVRTDRCRPAAAADRSP